MNLSVQGESIESPRVEIKNVAGAKNVERAVEYEYLRHIDLLSKGQKPLPETRKYEADQDRTVTLRIKDEAPDYRFFQDPDLPSITVSESRIFAVKQTMAEIPFETKKRFCSLFGLEVSEVKNVFKSPWSAQLFSRLVKDTEADPKLVYKW